MNLNLAVDQIVWNIWVFVEFWEPEKLEVPKASGDEDVKIEGLRDIKRNATVVVRYARQERTFIAYDNTSPLRSMKVYWEEFTFASLYKFAETTGK